MSWVVGLHNNSYKPITNTAWVRARIYKLQKGCTRLATASDKVYQFLAHGQWFSPDTPASSTTKTGRHDIAEILLKVALHTKNQSINLSQSNYNCFSLFCIHFRARVKWLPGGWQGNELLQILIVKVFVNTWSWSSECLNTKTTKYTAD